MHYVNGDIILSADGAERLQYLLSHPNPEEVQKKLKACTTNEDSCDDCMYREFCIRFYTPHCDSPNEWEILEKSGGIPC